jgi:hypothetical protein
MAYELEDCERMVALARQTGKMLLIGQNQRLAGAHQQSPCADRGRAPSARRFTFGTFTFPPYLARRAGNTGPRPGARARGFFDSKRAVHGAHGGFWAAQNRPDSSTCWGRPLWKPKPP